jgi:hypothetical protein
MKPGDYIIKPDGSCEATIWRITGIYLGALGHQDVVSLVTINRKPHCVPGEMYVPLELVEAYLCEARS